MDSEALLPTDPTERRRLQNRIAQRRFRQKKQLERRVLTANRVDQPTAAKNNGDNATSADISLDLAVIDNFSLGIVPTASGFQGSELDLGTLDDLLENYNTQPPLNAPLFPIHATAPSMEASRTGFSTDSDAVPSFDRQSISQIRSSDAEPNTLRDEMSPVPRNAVQECFGIMEGKGWLSALHIAAQKGHERILRMLLEQGNMNPNSSDSDGRTPLFYAAVGGHEPVVRLLLSHGSRISQMDNDRRNVLHWTAHYQHLEVLRALLEHWSEHERASCDLDAYDNHGWTPLHLAVERGFEEGVLLLIEWGANMDAKARKCWLVERVIPLNMNQLRS